jgi:hypothetical protein
MFFAGRVYHGSQPWLKDPLRLTIEPRVWNESKAGMSDNELYAALDLGSNSFHLLLARRSGDAFETVERIKEKVQLLGGFRGGELDGAAMLRGSECLARFAQRLRAVPRSRVRMVGTHALRESTNRDDFAAVAQRIVGVPLEVVSGEEEARLIYLGVAHHAPCESGESWLVVDIGGGSTELAWSERGGCSGEPEQVASFKSGCVSLTDAFFAAGGDQGAAYLAARDHALRALTGVSPLTRGTAVLGTSGTIESVQTVLAANGWGGEVISAEGMAVLREAIVSGRWLVEAGLPGLPPDRVDIFPAGVAVLDALFERLGMETVRRRMSSRSAWASPGSSACCCSDDKRLNTSARSSALISVMMAASCRRSSSSAISTWVSGRRYPKISVRSGRRSRSSRSRASEASSSSSSAAASTGCAVSMNSRTATGSSRSTALMSCWGLSCSCIGPLPVRAAGGWTAAREPTD